jgi:hypothetical protein
VIGVFGVGDGVEEVLDPWRAADIFGRGSARAVDVAGIFGVGAALSDRLNGNDMVPVVAHGEAASAAFEQVVLLDSLKKALTERALNAEMDHHLAGADGAGNMRNGYGRKTVMGDTGKLAIDVPRDRQASFDPQLIAKYQRRFPGFDDKIVPMYARGMSTREIIGHLHELYGIDVSPDLISTVTDAVLDEVATWQQRPLSSSERGWVPIGAGEDPAWRQFPSLIQSRRPDSTGSHVNADPRSRGKAGGDRG